MDQVKYVQLQTFRVNPLFFSRALSKNWLYKFLFPISWQSWQQINPQRLEEYGSTNDEVAGKN